MFSLERLFEITTIMIIFIITFGMKTILKHI